MRDDGETEEAQAWASSKIMPRPLTLPRQFKVEPSDFALGLVASDRDPTAHHMAEPTFIDLTMSDAEDAMPAPTKRRCAPALVVLRDELRVCGRFAVLLAKCISL